MWGTVSFTDKKTKGRNSCFWYALLFKWIPGRVNIVNPWLPCFYNCVNIPPPSYFEHCSPLASSILEAMCRGASPILPPLMCTCKRTSWTEPITCTWTVHLDCTPGLYTLTLHTRTVQCYTCTWTVNLVWTQLHMYLDCIPVPTLNTIANVLGLHKVSCGLNL